MLLLAGFLQNHTNSQLPAQTHSKTKPNTPEMSVQELSQLWHFKSKRSSRFLQKADRYSVIRSWNKTRDFKQQTGKWCWGNSVVFRIVTFVQFLSLSLWQFQEDDPMVAKFAVLNSEGKHLTIPPREQVSSPMVTHSISSFISTVMSQPGSDVQPGPWHSSLCRAGTQESQDLHFPD